MKTILSALVALSVIAGVAGTPNTRRQDLLRADRRDHN
jgi:hypothetical protein